MENIGPSYSQPASIDPRARVIIALDVDTDTQALQIVDALGDTARIYKVGLQLLTAVGPSIIRTLRSAGKAVYLDLKLFEIPNSVASAVKIAGNLGVSMLTVHASGGSAILRAETLRVRSQTSRY